MEFMNVIRTRRSIRAFSSQEIEPDALTSILKAIRSCPTAGNLQAYKVYVIEAPEKIKALSKAASDQDWIAGAPAVLVFCIDPKQSETKYGKRGRDLYCLIDATIAITVGHLATVAQGLGSTMVGAFNEAAVAKIIGLPSHLKPHLILPIGHPAEEPEPTSRRPLDELIERDCIDENLNN